MTSLINLIFNHKMLGESDNTIIAYFTSSEWPYTQDQVKQAINKLSNARGGRND